MKWLPNSRCFLKSTGGLQPLSNSESVTVHEDIIGFRGILLSFIWPSCPLPLSELVAL